MRKVLIFLIVLVTGVAAAMAFMLRRSSARPWSTTSVEALQEFEAGISAERKLYPAEARQHFQRAAALDPDFTIAKVKVMQYAQAPSPQSREQFGKFLEEASKKKLSDRERLMVNVSLARINRDRDRLVALIDDYLEEHPGDSYALNLRCGDAWERNDFAVAEKCYDRLLQADANFVLAQNNLGYIAMAQSRFDDAEEAFKMYKYIAPDQANPHDSLGELYTITGRYPEAQQELRRAIEVRSDFCPAYGHLILVQQLASEMKNARTTLEQMKKNCPEAHVQAFACSIDLWDLANQEKWSELIDAWRTKGCAGKAGDGDSLAHLAALETGDEGLALQIEDQVRKLHEQAQSHGKKITAAMISSMEGSRAAKRGDWKLAISRFEDADEKLIFWGDGQGVFKLYNLSALESAMRRSGAANEAQKVRQRIASVNPRFLDTNPIAALD